MALEMGTPGCSRDAMNLGSKATLREGHRLPTVSAKGQLGQGPSPPPTVKKEGAETSGARVEVASGPSPAQPQRSTSTAQEGAPPLAGC